MKKHHEANALIELMKKGNSYISNDCDIEKFNFLLKICIDFKCILNAKKLKPYAKCYYNKKVYV